MGGEIIFFLVAIVAVVVLIAGGIMRGMSQAQEEERRRQQRKSRPSAPPRARPSRPAANAGSDLDRFLNEVQRRKSGVPPPVEPIPVATVVEPRPVARPSPLAPPTPPREKAPPPRRPTPPRPRPGRRQDDIPMVVPVEEVIPAVEVVEERHAPKWEPRTAGPVDAAAPLIPQTSDQAYRTATPATRPPQAVAPAVVQLKELLKDRNSLRAALLLKEVLGPPRCKR